jgi:hypothetical protein
MPVLSKEQQAAFIDVINFVKDPNARYMEISGGAGTGKTFFISQVADTILRHAPEDSKLKEVVITATTNKAAAVISDAMPQHMGEIATIYGFLNLRVKEDMRTGVQSIIPTQKWTVHSNTFLIIDEDSMIDSDLFGYMGKALDRSCKILLVGDRNQLPPVKETISPIFKQGYPVSYLTKPVRNANQPALVALCEQAKQTVLTDVFTEIQPVPGVIDFVDKDTLRGILEREFLNEDPTKRILAYTNERVIQYNQFVRDLRGYTQPYEVGEILTNNQAAELQGKERLYTDQVVEVTRIISDFEDQKTLPGRPFRTIVLEVKDVVNKQSYEVAAFADPALRTAYLRDFANRKNWEKYFLLKNLFPDLRSVAASTTHKAQGSTYDMVIVDLADIGKCTIRSQTARMQYVALSRPKSRLYIRGKLPARYF